jgi:hypothetical protein
MLATFLETIWAPLSALGRFGEIRVIKEGSIDQHFQRLDRGVGGAIDWARQYNEDGWDAYFGVLPRVRQGGKAVDVVTHAQVLWADVDAKKVSDVLSIGKAVALGRLNSFPATPQVLVDSGGGYHAYWLLDRPEPYERIREVVAWIADVVGGDKVQDAPRVLRLPGTINWKREPYVPARLLRLDMVDGRRYRLNDLEGQMPIPRERRPIGERTWQPLPEWLEQAIAEGAPKGARSEACFRVILWLLRFGRSQEEIRTIFEASPDGIGAKYAEKPHWDRDRWLDYTIKAAEEVA